MKTDHKTYLQNLLKEGSVTPVDKDHNYELKLPVWYDDAKYKRAQAYFRENYVAMAMSTLYAQLALLAVPTIRRMLMSTGRSSTPAAAYRRYVATILHYLSWYYDDLKPGTRIWRSISYVRKAHVVNSKRANLKTPGMIIAQKDMAVVQFGFVGYIAVVPELLGVQYNAADMDAFVHFWRVIGYMLGIQDQYNLCTDNLETSKHRMQLVHQQILRPALQSVGEEFILMGRALVDGLWYTNPTMDYDTIFFMACRLTGVPGYLNYWNQEKTAANNSQLMYKKYSWFTRLNIWTSLVLHEVLLKVTILRWSLNWFFSVMGSVVMEYLPLMAIVKFGVKNSYVKLS